MKWWKKEGNGLIRANMETTGVMNCNLQLSEQHIQAIINQPNNSPHLHVEYYLHNKSTSDTTSAQTINTITQSSEYFNYVNVF